MMDKGTREVSSVKELSAAVADRNVKRIILAADLADVPCFLLAPGQSLVAAEAKAILRFAAGQNGVQLSRDNRVENLDLIADPDRFAVFNDTTVDQFGRLVLRNLRSTGAVQILARERIRGGHVEADGIHVMAADASAHDRRPKGYGVEVIPDALTLWNQQTDPSVVITADLTGLSAGYAGQPVRGSGIFISGCGEAGGRLIARRLETGPVYSNGGIAPGTLDRISGGVFVVHGAFVGTVHNHGPVTTYGTNDMVVDNWGTVDRWVADDRITSHGPSGIGFVNFGVLYDLQVNAPIETFGLGARGFNVYAGTISATTFERVVTHGDGAVGIQISQPVGDITVRRGIETHGGVGDSLVKGMVIRLAAIAVSIKQGGSVRRLTVNGGLLTHGEGVDAMELHGTIASLQVAERLGPLGGGFARIE
jgi:hypothetical protein